jgi:energy-coupling factor transport system substrate-specific component
LSKNTLYIKKLVLIALLGVSLNAFKLCLMYIPNVEVVTLLIVVYTYVFGLDIGISATLLFCCLEGVLWGFNPTWLVAYFIHWPAVSLVTYVLKKCKITKPIIIAIAITLVTAMFGLQSTFIYFLTGGVIGDSNWVARYWLMYSSGAIFYIVQCISAFVSIMVGFKALSDLLFKLKNKYFGYSEL